jgi:ribose transport system substrate-binding protein
MKPQRFLVWALLLLSPLAMFVGCDGNGNQAEQAQADGEGADTAQPAVPVVIGVSLLTRTHPFYQDLEAGLRETANAAGYELLVTAGEFDVAKQKDQIHDFIVRKVNAIIVCPCDSRSIGTAIKAANDAGIPVFTADIACLAEGVKVVSHVASDNVAGGRLAAQAIADAIGGSGKVAIIDHPEVESVIQRVRGFEEEIAKFEGITVVAKLSGHGVKDQAFRTAEDVLQAHPDLQAIFGINDDSALGALAAIEKAGKTDKVKVVGFDAVPEARKAIKEGKIFADVVQQPKAIGQKTIETISAYFSGSEVPPAILIPCALYTSTDAT